jgi:heat-inducible transcriptional repressor
MSLDDRKYRILLAIIDDYILTAMPVGSRTISRKSGMGLSSATIRNEMSDLEELGYLDQPHTSAGRIPSWRAYRLYVDQLMRVAGLPKEDQEQITSIFSRRMRQMEQIISSAANVLSDMTDYTAVVLAPQPQGKRLRRVQFVRISDERVLMVVVFEGGFTQEAVVAIPRDWPDDHLYMLSGLVTRRVDGRSVEELDRIVASLSRDLSGHERIFAELMDTVRDHAVAHRQDVVLGGAAKMLKHPEYADVEKARNVLNALETRDKLGKMLKERSTLEFSISIGPEIDFEGMEDCSLVTVSYRLGGEQTGAMGVIGPTRMHYARVISVLEGMRKTMEQVFDEEG